MQISVCSYKDYLVFGVASAFIEHPVMRNFFRDMVDMGVDVELDSNDFDRIGAAPAAAPAAEAPATQLQSAPVPQPESAPQLQSAPAPQPQSAPEAQPGSAPATQPQSAPAPQPVQSDVTTVAEPISIADMAIAEPACGANEVAEPIGNADVPAEEPISGREEA